MNNNKQMQLSWLLYADDNRDVLVPNAGGAQPNYTPTGCWITGNVSALPDETNSALLSSALLGPYTKSTEVYRCPADPGNPKGTRRVRSISMNNYMHGNGSGLTAGFTMNTRLSDVVQPASSYVFLDERASTINDGYFEVLMTTNTGNITIDDLPANYHGFAAGFAFADGHAVIQKWSTPLFHTPPTISVGGISAPNNADYIWLMRNTTVAVR